MLEYGFVTLNRSLLNWEWYDDINTTRLFIHLLLTVNYEDKQWRGILIERGQRVASYAILAEETGLTIKQIRRCVEKLEKTKSLGKKGQGKYTIFTLLNYDTLQMEGQAKGKQGASKGQAKGNNVTKLNKAKQSKTNNTLAQAQDKAQAFDSFWTAYPKKRSKEQAKKAWDKLMPSSNLLATMLRAIETQKKSNDWIKDNGQFIPYPATWLKAHGWEDEIEVKNGTSNNRDAAPDGKQRTAGGISPYDERGIIAWD